MSAEPLKQPLAASPADAGQRYGTVARVLHWLLAALIVGSFCVGLYMAGLPFSPLRLRLFNWHKWAGITILTLSAVRLLWRLTHPPPPLGAGMVAAMPGWQLTAYRATHLLLYLLFFVVPLLGWAYSSAIGLPIVLFGVLPLPDFVPVDKAFAEAVLKPMHKAGAFTLAAVVLVHVGAALKHRFIDRDDLLGRMWG